MSKQDRLTVDATGETPHDMCYVTTQRHAWYCIIMHHDMGIPQQCGTLCRCLLNLCLAEAAGLVKLGRSLHEQAGVFYLDESRRVLSLHAERRAPPPELNARISFKASYFCPPSLLSVARQANSHRLPNACCMAQSMIQLDADVLHKTH